MVDVPELVGKKTGKKTRVGRPVYKTKEGKFVSEKGMSIPLNKSKTKWLNAPSIYNGVQYSEDDILKFYKQGQIPESEYEIIIGSAKDATKKSIKRSSGLMPKIKKKTGGAVGVGKALRGYGNVRSYK
jgi:hypothetical protein|tara:strand:- start:312 stop:695 length:384 start_codon:yes stop_codon:yes gene_type:complete